METTTTISIPFTEPCERCGNENSIELELSGGYQACLCRRCRNGYDKAVRASYAWAIQIRVDATRAHLASLHSAGQVVSMETAQNYFEQLDSIQAELFAISEEFCKPIATTDPTLA